MSSSKNIGIITSGGDAGGLNAVLRGIAAKSIDLGFSSYVIPNGYAGLYNLLDIQDLVLLDWDRNDRISSMRAGSEAGHSRVKISKINDSDKYKRIRLGIKKHNLDGLIISGGDDTGSVVVDLVNNGIKCIHAPKTMDLDLQTYSVGADSTINRIARLVEEAKTTGITHNRIMITEVFGRYAGHTALRGGVASDADCILIPEIPVNLDIVYDNAKKRLMRRINNSDVKGGTYTIVVAEGIKDSTGSSIVDEHAGIDAFGHGKLTGAGKYVRSYLEKLISHDPEVITFMKNTCQFVPGIYQEPEIRELLPGHIVRSGSSSAYDVNFGKQIGAGAVALFAEGISGVTVVGGDEGEIRYISTKKAIRQRLVSPETISFYEGLGICFGRNPVPGRLRFKELSEVKQRYL